MNKHHVVCSVPLIILSFLAVIKVIIFEVSAAASFQRPLLIPVFEWWLLAIVVLLFLTQLLVYPVGRTFHIGYAIFLSIILCINLYQFVVYSQVDAFECREKKVYVYLEGHQNGERTFRATQSNQLLTEYIAKYDYCGYSK